MNALLLAIRSLVLPLPHPKILTLTPSSCTVKQPTQSLIAAGMHTRISRAVTIQRTEKLMVSILFQKLQFILNIKTVIRRRKETRSRWKYDLLAPSSTRRIITYLLAPWNRVLLEKLTGSAISQEITRI